MKSEFAAYVRSLGQTKILIGNNFARFRSSPHVNLVSCCWFGCGRLNFHLAMLSMLSMWALLTKTLLGIQ
jgi:hypothetical protein